VKVAFREEGVRWLSQGKSDENKMMRNSFHLSALLELFWQAQRTVCSQPIYEVCKSLKKKEKKKGQEMLHSPHVPLWGLLGGCRMPAPRAGSATLLCLPSRDCGLEEP